MSDLTLDKTYRIGAKGNKVKLIQEWLCLHGFNIAMDKDFGPATDYAVRQFQKKKNLTEDGIVGQNTFARLIQPMTDVLKKIPADSKSLGQMVIACAKQHVKSHPTEIGGQNRGPWVRLYMKGNEGTQWPWCAGFVSFVMKQACDSLHVPLPVTNTFSCDIIATSAKEKDIFREGSKISDKRMIKPGSLFLNRRTSTDWVHTGFVLKAEDDIFHTIEGNTNDEGSWEGYEACQRIRGYNKKDFVLI